MSLPSCSHILFLVELYEFVEPENLALLSYSAADDQQSDQISQPPANSGAQPLGVESKDDDAAVRTASMTR
jgi:hypothetical protein